MGQEALPVHLQDRVVDLNAQLLSLGETALPAVLIEGSVRSAPVGGCSPRSIHDELVL